MKIERTFLRSKVARRVLLHFVLAALVPVSVTALIVHQQSRDNLIEQSRVQLMLASKAMGQTILERMQFVDRETGEIASGLYTGETNPEQLENVESEYLKKVYVVTDTMQVPVVSDASFALPESTFADIHLSEGRAILVKSAIAGKHPRFLIGRSVDVDEPRARVLVAEVNLDSVLRDSGSLPDVIHYCVLDAQGTVLHCTSDSARATVAQVRLQHQESTQGAFRASDDTGTYLGAYSAIFLTGRFLGPNWTILTIRPEADAMAPIAAFNSVFVPVVLLSVLLVAYLSVTQIRKILVPLDRLVRGTHQIARQKFSSVIRIASGDEFEVLARSMNSMARSLGAQFETLQSLSEVDRLILSRAQIETILEEVLSSLRKVCRNDLASVAIIDDDADNAARVFIDKAGNDLTIERVFLTEHQRQSLSSGGPQIREEDDASDSLQQTLVKLGARSIYVFPIILDHRLSAVISLGYCNRPVPATRKLAQVSDFADRVAVAMRTVEREEQLYRQAHFDPLTALPNRQLFRDRLEQAIIHAQREHRKGALLFIDFDRFKVVNDSQGHSVGDELLKQAAVRLRQHVRETDTVARLGGDEFTVVLSNISSSGRAGRISDELVDLLSRPFDINGRTQYISASIGVTIFPDDGNTVEDLLKNADTAMYRAKENGRGRHTFFTEQMNVDAVSRHQIESDLHNALAEEQFFVEYQPQIELSSNRVIGAEALVRWRHPVRGVVSPADFIPVAEETGHIKAIGHWVLKSACRRYRIWQSRNIAPERIAVNVSPAQFADEGYVASVAAALAESGLAPECLELEITENLLLDTTQKVLQKLETLHAMGIRIAIDDFGTGYSSMSYLNQLSFDVLKIDRSFVAGLSPTDGSSQAVVNAIIGIAASLDKEIVAEGIETLEQSAVLARMNCRCGQGKLFSMPMPARQYALFMKNRHKKKAS